jgi:hypothetical protein
VEYSAFLIALKACFTEREVDRLSSRAIHFGLPDELVMSAADCRLRILLSGDALTGPGDDSVGYGADLYQSCTHTPYASSESI